jgi:hypothetical protein
LTSALDGDEWSTSRPGRFNPGKEKVIIGWKTCWTPDIGLDTVEWRKFQKKSSNRIGINRTKFESVDCKKHTIGGEWKVQVCEKDGENTRKKLR